MEKQDNESEREREREREQMDQLVNNDVIFGREWRSICSYLISNDGRLFNESLKEELEMTSYWSYYSTQAVVDPCFCVCSVFCSNDVWFIMRCHGDKWSCLKEDDIVSYVKWDCACVLHGFYLDAMCVKRIVDKTTEKGLLKRQRI
eukprot:105353_1